MSSRSAATVTRSGGRLPGAHRTRNGLVLAGLRVFRSAGARGNARGERCTCVAPINCGLTTSDRIWQGVIKDKPKVPPGQSKGLLRFKSKVFKTLQYAEYLACSAPQCLHTHTKRMGALCLPATRNSRCPSSTPVQRKRANGLPQGEPHAGEIERRHPASRRR